MKETFQRRDDRIKIKKGSRQIIERGSPNHLYLENIQQKSKDTQQAIHPPGQPRNGYTFFALLYFPFLFLFLFLI